jgi:signal transduction histidine kinase/ActR/RegA family two-component response regulator
MLLHRRITRKRESIFLLVTAVALAGYIGFVLYTNFLSHKKLRETSIRLISQEMDKRATDLRYFSETLRKDVRGLAFSGKIDLFFENKALGMSMEYGLRSTLHALGDAFRIFVDQKKLNAEPIYARVVFLDQDDHTLIDTEPPASRKELPAHLKRFFTARPEGFFLFFDGDLNWPEVVYTAPFFFKGGYSGQIVAWLIPQNVFTHFLTSPSGSVKHTGIACSRDHVLKQADGAAFNRPEEGGIFWDEQAFGALLQNQRESGETSVLQVAVAGTPFTLFEIWQLNEIFGKTSPRTLLLAMALLAVVVMGALAYGVLVVTQNRVLHTRIIEAGKKEEEIAEKNRELKAEIDERIRAEQARAQLEVRLQRAEKMEALGTLAGGVAHDLNNILSGIVGYPDLLLMEMPEESPMRAGILTIKKSGEKAAAIVQDLLYLARRAVPDKRAVNLNDIVREYLKSPEYQKLHYYHPEVETLTRLEAQPLPISGSPMHLSKAFMNLVSNAAEAMPHGGTIEVATANTYVDRPFRGYDSVEEGEYVVLEVRDNGIGIAPENIERIFEPFYTKKTMGRSGTGLGMAVVWGTVKDHHGYIDVQSAEGRGTTFKLYLPVTRTAVAEINRSYNLEEYLGQGESILVVDDMPEQRQIATMMLEKLGYTVSTAASGAKAVDWVVENPVDLVVLDMIMDPGIDGLETYQQIKNIHPDQKVVIASGFSETDRVKAAIELGVSEYVRKPYSLEKIGLSVRRALQGAENGV